MTYIIIINGVGGSGKDTFIDKFKEVACNSAEWKCVVERISSVDFVKHIAKLAGWDGVKDNKGRQFLSDLKDAMTAYDDGPYKYCVKEALRFTFRHDGGMVRNNWKSFLFIHVREPKEIKKLVDALGATTILIHRTSAEKVDFTNHADKGVFDYEYDHEVLNDGTIDDLKRAAEVVFNSLVRRK